MDRRRSSATPQGPWNTLVVLVATCVDARGKPSIAAERAKQALLLAAESSSAEGDLFTVVSRATLESKGGGKDPKTLSTTLRQMIKQDRVKGAARKQKEQDAKNVLEASIPMETKKEQKEEDEAIDTEEHPTVEPFDTKEREILRQLEMDSTIRIHPTEEELQAARSILEIENSSAKPDKIYLLKDFPSTIQETQLLVSSSLSDCCLDIVVELVGFGATEGAAQGKARTLSQFSDLTAASEPNYSTSAFGDCGENVNSTISLPSVLPSKLINSETFLGSVSKGKALMHGAQAKKFRQESKRFPADLAQILKEAQTKARGPGWKDLAFLELPIAPNNESDDPSNFTPLEILRSFTNLVFNVGCEKYRFQEYIATCKHIAIPKTSQPPVEGLFEIYRDIVLSNPSERRRTIGCILSSIVESIEVGFGEKSREEGNKGSKPKRNTAMSPSEAVVVLEFGDHVLSNALPTLLELEGEGNIIQKDLAYWRSIYFPGGLGRHLMPRWPTQSEVERGIKSSQFGLFHSFSAERVEHIRRIEGFETLLANSDPMIHCPWDFGNRCFVRRMSPQVAAQVIGNAVAEEPQILLKYLEDEDKLLVALHRQTPVGRICEITRSPFAFTNLRPTFSEWPSVDLRVGRCIFDVEPDLVAKIEQTASVLYPCDHSVVLLESTNETSGAWCTVLKDHHRFGLRKRDAKKKDAADGSFFASFQDNTFLEVFRSEKTGAKPDGFDTMSSHYTTADGLNVVHTTDGLVSMWLTDGVERKESSRKVVGCGSLVIFNRDGSQSILHPNGDVVTISEDKSKWELVSFCRGGVKTTKTLCSASKAKVLSNPEEKESKVTIEVAFDAGSQTHILFRPIDGTCLIRQQGSGDMVACFSDGSRIVTTERGDIVRVEKPGYATVKFVAAIENMAHKHSRGARVDISRGGKAIRSTTLVPDATIIHVEYDTRVTAKVNGYLRVLKPDGTSIEVNDSGYIGWRSWDLDIQQAQRRRLVLEREEAKQLPADAREEADRDLGVYIFNCDQASVRLRDWESNFFEVNNATIKSQRSVNVKLSGAFDPVEAIINSAIPPRLFLLDGSGGGWEYLCAEQLEKERKVFALSNRGSFCSANFEPVQVEERQGDVQGGVKINTTRNTGSKLRPPPSPKKKKSGEVRARKPEGLSNTATVWVGLGLPQLLVSKDMVPEFLTQVEVSKKFATKLEDPFMLSRTQYPFSLPLGGDQTLGIDSNKSRWMVRDEVLIVDQIRPEEREQLLNASFSFMAWKKDMEKMEDRFNVEDMRPESQKEEERRMQEAILKERQKLLKLEKKKIQKNNVESSSQVSSRSLRQQQSHRSGKSGKSGRSLLKSSRQLNADIRNGGEIPLDTLMDNFDLDSGSDFDEWEERKTGQGDIGEDCQASSPTRAARPAPRNAPINEEINFWATDSVSPLEEDNNLTTD